jgi:four helix bundle protein
VNKIQRFEDIVAWQKARLLAKDIYECSKTGSFARDHGLRGQIQRAAVSAMANVAEGYERGGDKEFRQFLSNSKGSCAEVKSHLYVALDQGYLAPSKFQELYAKADEVGRLVFGFMQYIRQSQLAGRKFK